MTQETQQLILFIIYQTLVTVLVLIQTTFVAIYRLVVPYRYRSKSVRGETVLVTGAGSGIGKLVSKKFAKLGAKLVLVDIDEKAVEKSANEILMEGGTATWFKCDLSNRDEIYKVADEIKKSVGNVDILVNNAGIVTGKKLLESSDVAIEKTMAVNTMAHFWLTKRFLPSMLEKNHGHVVTVASIAGIYGTPGLCDYSASKFAAVGFDDSLRNELIHLKKTGVHTTCVCPFYIDTGMFDGTKGKSIIPLLKPDYAADKIIEAVLTNQKLLIMPRIFYFTYLFKGIMAQEAENYVQTHFFKTSSSMDHFVGRNKVN